MDGRPSRHERARKTAARSPAARLAFLACLLLILMPSSVRAQLPAGRFVRDAAAGEDLEKVVSASVPKVKSALAKIFKGKAKSRLRQVIVAAAWLKFTPEGESIRLETDAWSGDRSIVVKPGATLHGWRRYWPNGKVETLDVLTHQQGNALTYRYIAEDGQRTDTYVLDGDVLVLSVTLESGQLSSPIHYRLVYRREKSAP